ncbi:MAG TPA: DUF2461 domain-containing protein [Acidimicrobiales bacterium]|nr:DUF2461 domain-containing protein [Acidimicrobiales bacterium]
MAFRGFPEEALEFYEGLEADNSRTYWTDRKATYDTAVLGPMRDLVALVAAEFGELKIFRPYRDVRFSKDKAPYKTNIAAAGDTPGGASVYVGLSADGLFSGSGYYRMAKDQLERYRRAVDDDRTGDDLTAAVKEVEAAGFEVHGSALKTAPRGFPRDHPRIELLRMTGVYAGRQFPVAKWLHTKACADKVVAAWRGVRPVTDWLDTRVGPSTIPPEGRR